uniref:F-ATPase gamma subunit n=1 Tax=Musa acuminata subsp. malaccensis TaxID=214687 RepID=A0A804I396_MUSAM
MKLVAAAKVRRAQEAVVSGRPFSETLVEVLYNINEQLQTEDVDVPLTRVHPVRKIALVVVTADRGLCGGFNNNIIKKAEQRIRELSALGIAYTVISVGKKGNSYFQRRPNIPVDRFLEDVDKVELLYTKFVSLLFRLTTNERKLTVERETVRTPTPAFSPILQFEQDPVQILDALLPLYLNSQILRALQESLASEFAARMTAMINATDNAVELRRTLSIVYNRERQAKITGGILEIVAGADALS